MWNPLVCCPVSIWSCAQRKHFWSHCGCPGVLVLEFWSMHTGVWRAVLGLNPVHSLLIMVSSRGPKDCCFPPQRRPCTHNKSRCQVGVSHSFSAEKDVHRLLDTGTSSRWTTRSWNENLHNHYCISTLCSSSSTQHCKRTKKKKKNQNIDQTVKHCFWVFICLSQLLRW